jgi:hypothetical protein
MAWETGGGRTADDKVGGMLSLVQGRAVERRGGYTAMVSHEQWHQHSMLYTGTHTPKKEEDVNPPNNSRRPPSPVPLKLTASPHPQIHHPQELPRPDPQPSRQVRCPRRRFRRCSRLLRPLLLRRGTQGTRRHHEEDSRSRQVLHQRDTARG